jgi:hypothetical protein
MSISVMKGKIWSKKECSRNKKHMHIYSIGMEVYQNFCSIRALNFYLYASYLIGKNN